MPLSMDHNREPGITSNRAPTCQPSDNRIDRSTRKRCQPSQRFHPETQVRHMNDFAKPHVEYGNINFECARQNYAPGSQRTPRYTAWAQRSRGPK